VLTWLVVALAIGFPVVVGLAWIFDVNEGRLERTEASGLGGARLLIVLAGVGVLAAAPGVIWYLVVRRPVRSAPADAGAAPSIAVLPLVNLSSDKEQEYFSDGLTEELLNLLAKVPGLKVAGRTSSFAFKGKNEDLRSIAQKLGVAPRRCSGGSSTCAARSTTGAARATPTSAPSRLTKPTPPRGPGWPALLFSSAIMAPRGPTPRRSFRKRATRPTRRWRWVPRSQRHIGRAGSSG